MIVTLLFSLMVPNTAFAEGIATQDNVDKVNPLLSEGVSKVLSNTPKTDVELTGKSAKSNLEMVSKPRTTEEVEAFSFNNEVLADDSVSKVLTTKEAENTTVILEDAVTIKAEILKTDFKHSEAEASLPGSELVDEAARSIIEDEVKVINAADETEKISQIKLCFTPELTGVYTVTASKAELYSMYITDSEGKTLVSSKSWPEKSNSVAFKLYKGCKYYINAYVNTELPVEFLVNKFKSQQTEVVYKIKNNTYTLEDVASVAVEMPCVPADIVAGALQGDLLFEAELFKNGISIEKIEVPKACIRGGTGTPEDNLLQFVCNFGAKVEFGEYSIKINCKDSDENAVIEECQTSVKIGNDICLYTPENSYYISGHGTVYFNNINTSEGKFILVDETGKTIGSSGNVGITTKDTGAMFFGSNYNSTSNEYDERNFTRTLYYSDIPTIYFNGLLQSDKEYRLKLVAGVSQFEVPVKVIATGQLIVQSISFNTLYEATDNNVQYADLNVEFFNSKNVDMENINFEIMDMYGNVVASKVEHISRSENSFIFRMRINKTILEYNNYTIRISYPGKLYVNQQQLMFNSYPTNNSLKTQYVRIVDYKVPIIEVVTSYCDKAVEYKAELLRKDNHIPMLIGELSGLRSDNEGVFKLDFSGESKLPLLNEGGLYSIVFSDKRGMLSSIDFNVPASDGASRLDQFVTFYPPMLPKNGTVEFSLSGYGIDNGIMGTENVDIELIGDGDAYGTVEKSTIKKTVSVYSTSPYDNIEQVMISGTLNISKELKEDTRYFIRINGMEYEYFYNTKDKKLNIEGLKIEDYNNFSSTYFKDLEGENKVAYRMYNNEELELSCNWVKGFSDNAELLLVDVMTKEEIQAGVWNTVKTYYDEAFKDIKIKADLTKVKTEQVYEICLRDGEEKLSFNKYIIFPANYPAGSFTVQKAVYGSDLLTLSFSRTSTIEGYSFNVVDSLDNIISCTETDDRITKDSRIVDLRLDTELNYGKYSICMCDEKNVRRSQDIVVTQEKVIPSVNSVQYGYPILILGENLEDDVEYIADMSSFWPYTNVKKGVKLIKRTGGDTLEINQGDLDSLTIGNYNVSVKADGEVIGNVSLYYNGSLEIKPTIIAKEWIDGSMKKPLLEDKDVSFDINTLYYTKVKFAENLDDLNKEDYQTVSNNVYYSFAASQGEKTLYFQLVDDFENESEVYAFKAYLSENRPNISIITPEEGAMHATDLKVVANISGSPSFAGVAFYSKGYTGDKVSYSVRYSRELKPIDDKGNYSAILEYGSIDYIEKVEVFTADEVGNINSSKVVMIKKPELVATPVSKIDIKFDNKDKHDYVKISGNTTNGEGNITVYAYKYNNYSYNSWASYNVKLFANEDGDFEGVLNIPVNGKYRLVAQDFTGLKSPAYNGDIIIDTVAPVLKDYDTVAQSVDSVKISWEVNDDNECFYTIWKDEKLLFSGYRAKLYIATGLDKGQTYIYKIMATDVSGNTSEPVQIVVEVGDAVVPEVPQNLVVSSHASKSISLSWKASSDNSFVTGYEIFRDDTKVAVSYTNTYTDLNLETGVEYSYKIRAFDPSMNYSDFSETIKHTPVLNSIKDAYEGSYSFVGYNMKRIELKALTSDILNASDMMVTFEYRNGEEDKWNYLTSSGLYVKTPDGLLFKCMWDVEYMPQGDYTIRYTAVDRDGAKQEAMSEAISILEVEDNEKPEIVAIKPDASCFTTNIPVVIMARDNINLRKIGLQTSLDGLEWVEAASTTMYNTKEYSWRYNLDISKVREGEFYVRAIATDGSGNVSEKVPYTQYIIDNTAPEKVQNVTAISYADCIEIRWDKNSEPYIKSFSVLRSEEVSGLYTTIALNVVSLNYFDRDVKPGKTYYYKVICNDIAGNSSYESNPVEIAMLDAAGIEDNEKPVVTSDYPMDKMIIGSKLTYVLVASDNINLSKLAAEYSLDGKEWVEFFAIPSSYQKYVYTADLNTKEFPSGSILKIRGYAVDLKGNVSDYVYSEYTIDNIAPKGLKVVVEPIGRGFNISWSCDETDIVEYELHRRTSDSEFYTIVGEFGSATLSVIDKDLDPSKQYIYKLIATDKLINTAEALSEAVSPLDIDDVLPIPHINSVSSAEVGMEVEFDASASKDNVGITKYCWNFGDGTLIEGANVSHIYMVEGEYKVVLSVEDSSGNKNSIEKSITILKKDNSGILNITVRDNSGKYIPYANIYVNLNTEDQFKVSTDMNGMLTLKLEPGIYDIGAYQDGYSPEQQDILLAENEESNLDFVLEETKIVVGNIKTTKLSFEEIKAAGIDVYAPGNQNVFRYEINLNYNSKPYTVAGYSGTSNSSSVGTGGFGSGGELIGGREITPIVRRNRSTGEPFILLIDIPGRVTWLKEFFDVKLHLINTEGSYDLENCVATLNLPKGVSIASDDEQSVSIGTIGAKESKTLNWIIRGDAPGNYNISADFNGMLESFNEPVKATFASNNPIVVNNSSGLKLIVEVEEKKVGNVDLLYRVGFVNEKSSAIYLPNINMGHSTFIRSYKTRADMSLVKTSYSSLLPGEILWKEYTLDPELYGENADNTLFMKELASTALGGLEMPIETRMVAYGTFGRLKTQIYVLKGGVGSIENQLTLTKYRSKKNDKMPDLMIVTGRGISKDNIVHEESELIIKDGIKDTTNTVKTDDKGIYIHSGYSIDDVLVKEGGISYFRINVSSSDPLALGSHLGVRIIDQNLLPEDSFGTISGKVTDKDIDKAIIGADVTYSGNKIKTNAYGRFEFKDVLFEEDTITVEAKGFPKKTIEGEMYDGRRFEIELERMPEVTRVRSYVSDSSNPSCSILPLNLAYGSLFFSVSVDLKGAGEVSKYLYKIVDRYGKTKYIGENETDYIEVKDIRSKMVQGDRILFAVEAVGTYGTTVSDYVDAKIVMALEFPPLNAVSWLNELETAFENTYDENFGGIKGLYKFVTGKKMPDIEMPSDSGPIKSLSITQPTTFDFDLDVQYDFFNGKAVFTTKTGTKSGLNGSWANFKVPDQVGLSATSGISSEQEVTLTLIFVYNDSTLNWEVEKFQIAIASELEIKIITLKFKYNVPIDAYFGGVLLSGYVSLEINGKITFFTNISVEDLGSIDSIEDFIVEFHAIIEVTLRAAIGLEVAYGLLGGEFWAQGGISITVPTGKTILSLAIGFKETFVWFITAEQEIGREEWVLYDPEARPAQNVENNAPAMKSPARNLEKRSVKREAYSVPAANNTASEEKLFETSPRDYLEKQKWIGKEEIIQYAYPQSDAKISEIKDKNEDLLMVFVGDDRERSDNNRTALYYSIYEGGKWSEPKQVENDGTADAFPNISVDSQNTYAIWLDMDEKIGDLSKVAADYISKNILSKMKLRIAKFDHEKAIWKTDVSPETEGLNKLPQIATENGKTIATWVNNYGKVDAGTKENPDDIYFVYNDGSGWTEPKAFVTNAQNINKSDLLLHNGRAYFVYTTDAYSQDGQFKLYSSVFDGEKWSKPKGILDNKYNDTHPSMAVENGKPVVFFQNNHLIYKADIQSGKNDIVVNSERAFGIQELQATNTDGGIALAWTNASAGEQRLFISTYDDESSTWTQGMEIKHNSMEIPRNITVAGNGNEVLTVYNKSVYKKEDGDLGYQYDGTLLTSTSYVRKIDMAIAVDGILVEDEALVPGGKSDVNITVENVGDLTAKNISVALYDGEKLIGKEKINNSMSHGSRKTVVFECQTSADCTELKLKAEVEVADDGDTSNNISYNTLTFADIAITRIFNELYEKNRGYAYIDVTNLGFTVFDSAKLELYTDKEFKNLIASKEIRKIYPSLAKKTAVEFEVTEEQVKERVRLYAKVVVDQAEFDYKNNSDFTVVRPIGFADGTETVTPDPTPVVPEPTPVTPEPTPVVPKPTPVEPEVTHPTQGKTPGNSSNGTSGSNSPGSGNSSNNGGTETVPKVTPTPILDTTKPTKDTTEKTETDIPGSGVKQRGYMKGYEDNSFRPDNNITRAEMATILANLDSAEKTEAMDVPFNDIDNKHWAAQAIKYVSEKGYFKGYEDNSFKPDNYISRAELAVVICKYFNYSENADYLGELTDTKGHWAESYISMLTSKGFVKGYSDKTFKPDNKIKRSECTALVNRALGLQMKDTPEMSFKDVDNKHWAYRDIAIATQK